MNSSDFDLQSGEKIPAKGGIGRFGLAIVALLTLGFISVLAFDAPSRWLFGSVGAESTIEQADSPALTADQVDPTPTPVETPDPVREKYGPSKVRLSYEYWGPFDYDLFVEREKAGEFPSQAGDVYGDSPYNFLTNNDAGATGTSLFTQSETSLTAFGNTVVVGFNDSGSNAGGTNKFTGFARSTDGGATFTDGGTLPTSVVGDAGDPVLARDNVTGRIYLSTLGFSGAGTIQMWRSDDNGATWQAPINATPGGSTEDKQWHTVDNFAGPGQGNVYLMSRRFGGTGGGPGIYMFRSTDGGATFGPANGVQIVAGAQGAFVAVGPDHSVYAFWYAGATLQMRKSTDFGLTFAAPVTVASGLVGGTNGDLALTGLRQGTATFSGFRSNEFPHVAVNPVSGHLYTVFANNPAGVDKADIFFVQSTDGGATWSPAVRVNDDATTTDQWQPTIAVSPTGDRVGFFYYSREEDAANNNLFKYWGRIGAISGATVTLQPSFAVSDTASLPEFGRDSLINSVYMGDYDHAVATPGFFHVTWSDSRSDLPGGGGRKNPNVFYKKIPLGLAVSTTVPAINSILNTTPTSFVVNFTDAIDATTVSASDFTVNGIPATSFVVNDGDTVTFSYGASPVTAQGVQTMAMAAGSVTRLSDGDPLLEFTGTFRYDAVPLNVISTSPPFPNGVFTLPGPFTYDVTFNEPINPASVATTDLSLSGIAGATVTGVSVLPGNTTARFTINVASEGTLTAAISAGAVTDAFGNPGNAFSANYGVDIGTVPYPALAAKEPIGSLIYDPLALGTINFAGDADNFTIDLDPNQTISIIVRPTSASLRPRVELFDPGNVSLGFASAGAPNVPTGIQTRAITAPGTYRIEVSGVGATTGNYSVQVILNAAVELEGLIPGSNNTAATAENINGSFLDLSTSLGTAKRGAVNGTSDSASYSAAATPFGFEDIAGTGTVVAALTNVDDVSTSVAIPFSFPFYGTGNNAVFVSSNGLLTFGAANTGFTNADLTTSPTQAAIAVFWDDQHTGGGLPSSGVLTQRLDAGGPNDRFIIQWNNVRFFSGGTAGDTITYQAVLFADGRVRLNYADIVSGTAGGNNGASATVGVKASGTQGIDRLLLAFNNGPNTFVGTGQSTLISPPSPTPDYYSFTAAAGDVVTVAGKGLGLTGVNVQLRNAADAVLATGVGADNLSSVINNFAVPGAGTYFVRVTGAAVVPYNVVVTRNAAFDTEPNDAFATPQTLGGNRSALGAIVGSQQYFASNPSPGFEDISATGTRIAALNDQDDAAASVPIGFSFPFYGAGNTDVFVSSNGLLTFGSGNTAFTNADLTASPSQAGIAVFWDDQHTGGGTAASGVYTQVSGVGNDQHLTIQWNQVRFFSGGTAGDTLTYQAQLFADGRVRLNYLDLASGTAGGNNGASASVGIKAAGTQGPNRLLLAFNNGPNSFVGTGVSTLIATPPGEDWYSFAVAPGQNRVEVETATPGDGPGEFVNNLNPDIALFDPSGALVVAGTDGVDGRNETINATGLTAAGTYRVRVRGDADTVGEYFLSTRVTTETTETVTVTPSTVQYSDTVNLTATISPTSVLGVPPATHVTFTIGSQSFGPVALAVDGSVLRGTVNNAQILQAAGAYTVTATFSGVAPGFIVENPTTPLTVTREDTNIVLAEAYPFSVQVNNPGGTAGPLTRCVDITDTDTSLGNINLATVSVSVSAVGPGPSPTQSAVAYSNPAPDVRRACVTLSNIAVNVYDITFTVTGNYYQGSRDYVLVIFDPSLGFITGGGRVINPNTGNEMNFGINAKYLKNGNSKGNLLVVEHTPTGDIVLKSNAIQSLSMAGSNTAIFIGKATLNGVGNHSFRAVVQDNGEPGTNDKFGLQVTAPGGALVPSLTFDLRTITGGNIQVPHTPNR